MLLGLLESPKGIRMNENIPDVWVGSGGWEEGLGGGGVGPSRGGASKTYYCVSGACPLPLLPPSLFLSNSLPQEVR